jgi:hypothetical protein
MRIREATKDDIKNAVEEREKPSAQTLCLSKHKLLIKAIRNSDIPTSNSIKILPKKSEAGTFPF